MGDGALGVSQVGGNGDEVQGIDEFPRRIPAAAKLKSDYTPEAAVLLPLGQCVLWM